MKNHAEIILGGGFGSSGLSALMDLLSEVEDTFVTPQEFRLINDPDGITTLESNLVDNWSMFQGNVSIRRFSLMAKKLGKKYTSPYPGLDYTLMFGKEYSIAVADYIQSLVELSFIGLSYGVDTLLKRQLNQRVPLLRRSRLTNIEMFVAKNPTRDEFQKITKKFLLRLAKYALEKNGKSRFVIDEGFASMNIEKIINYLPVGSKIIVMIRDPRDVYSELKISNDAWMFQPKGVADFARYQKSMFDRWEEQKRNFSYPNQLLEVKFDDLILEYEKTRLTIFEFLSIDKDHHIDKYQKLDPRISRKNVGQWSKRLEPIEKDVFSNILGDTLKKYNWD